MTNKKKKKGEKKNTKRDGPKKSPVAKSGKGDPKKGVDPPNTPSKKFGNGVFWGGEKKHEFGP